MLVSHRFGSAETLTRARYWLSRHGFEVVSPDEPTHDASRLTLKVHLSGASAVLALIDSLESRDPAGWPGNGDPSRMPRAGAIDASSAESPAHASPIHWYGPEASSPADPVSSKTREYMFSRWE